MSTDPAATAARTVELNHATLTAADIVADYRRAYGRAPGRLIGVAVVSDSDNTRQIARAWYGDIRLTERRP